ncbi:hypothetical protein ACHWQZ_G001472 [Mnemiopsis leidyi]
MNTVHRKEKPHKCRFCDKTFGQSYGRRRHEEVVHHQQKPFECQFCDKTFGQNWNKNNHERMVHGLNVKPVQCRICDKTFSYRHDRKTMSQCDICFKMLSDPYKVARHKNTIHFNQKPYECRFCDKKFGQNGNRKKHEKTGDNFVLSEVQCDICLKTISRHALIRHKNTVHYKRKPHKCRFCDKTFGETGFVEVCHICNREVTKYKLQRHLDAVHYNLRPFPCDLCDKRFSSSSKLKRHKGATFLYKTCDICHKSVQDVNRHKNLVHYKIKPYPCHFCEKYFGTSYNRNSHERSIHGAGKRKSR